MAGGRPTDYTEDMGDTICENIASGVSLSKMCKALFFGILRKQTFDFALLRVSLQC